MGGRCVHTFSEDAEIKGVRLCLISVMYMCEMRYPKSIKLYR